MNFSRLLRLMRFWPPLLGAGIKVLHFSPDCRQITVQMRLRFWNKNYVGTHFGGSLYSMTDPFYMLMLVHALGREYIVWDKSATIRYKTPARGSVFAQFNLTQPVIKHIKETLMYAPKIDYEFEIPITDTSGQVVAEVKKTLHVSKKRVD